jgi:hypothetical protein
VPARCDAIDESREHVAATPAPISLYATRWKPLLATLGFAGLIVVDLLSYFVWPTPAVTANRWQYQEPAKTILHVVMLLVFATFFVFAVYWTLTPRPLLQVSASRLVCRRFPFPTRTISWEDVAYVSAGVARKATSPLTHATILTLWFSLKPDRLAAGSEEPPLHLAINPGTLSLRADEVVQLIRSYHAVQWLPYRPKPCSRAQGQTGGHDDDLTTNL